LLSRGIISEEQFRTGDDIERSAVVAAMLIKAGKDRGFLNGKNLMTGLKIIRDQEAKYLLRMAGKA
jgi:hypothetical protein